MPVPKEFDFSALPSHIRRECSRRVVMMFGKKWRQVCELSNDDLVNFTLEADGKELRFDSEVDLTSVSDFGEPEVTKNIACFENGKLHDDIVGGLPALVEYRYDDNGDLGRIFRTAHFQNGKLNDPKDGVPAVVQYDEEGLLR